MKFLPIFLMVLSGCNSPMWRSRPDVIAIPGETVPHKISRGEVSLYDGWVVPTPLFNELAPCFRDALQPTPIPKRE